MSDNYTARTKEAESGPFDRMTALDQYARLEAVGYLKRGPAAEAQEVVVSLGKSTLTMSAIDKSGDTPLSHWSLAALTLLHETETGAVFSLSSETPETLTTEDPVLKVALRAIMLDRATHAPAPPRRRWPLVLGSGALLLAIAVLTLPAMIRGLAKDMLSPERAAILTSEMTPMIEARVGPACSNAEGDTALAKLASLLNPDGETKFAVHDLGDVEVISLPGGHVLINSALLERSSQKDIAIWTALGIAGIIDSPAVESLFEGAGLTDAVRFLVSGALPERAKMRAINQILLESGPPSDAALANAAQILSNAGYAPVDLSELAQGRGIATAGAAAQTALSEVDWAALRTICGT